MNDAEKLRFAAKTVRKYDVANTIRRISGVASHILLWSCVGEMEAASRLETNDARLNTAIVMTLGAMAIARGFCRNAGFYQERLQYTCIERTGFDPAEEVPTLEEILTVTEPVR